MRPPLDERPAPRSVSFATLFLIPAGFALGLLAGLLLSNHQSHGPLAGGVDAVSVPLAVSTVRVPTPRPAPQTVPTVAQAPSALPTAVVQVPVPPPAPTAIVAAPSAQTYTILAGDTLTLIAGRLNVGVQELIDVNNITDPSTIEVGQVLLVP